MYNFFIFFFFFNTIVTHIRLCVIQTEKNYSDIKHAMPAEYCGAVDACILNIEKDGGILFSWEVRMSVAYVQCVPSNPQPFRPCLV